MVGDLRSELYLKRNRDIALLLTSLFTDSGLAPLSETNKERAAHREMINSMKMSS